RLPDLELAAIRLLLTQDHAKQRGLAGAVRADDADDAAARQAEVQAVDQHALSERLVQAFGLDHLIAQAGPWRDGDLAALDVLRTRLIHQLFIGLKPRLALGLARLRRGTHPLQLLLQLAL